MCVNIKIIYAYKLMQMGCIWLRWPLIPGSVYIEINNSRALRSNWLTWFVQPTQRQTGGVCNFCCRNHSSWSFLFYFLRCNTGENVFRARAVKKYWILWTCIIFPTNKTANQRLKDEMKVWKKNKSLNTIKISVGYKCHFYYYFK